MIVCQWLHHLRLWLAVTGFGLGICRGEAPRLCLVETQGGTSSASSNSILRAVCVLCCCEHELEQQLSEHRA